MVPTIEELAKQMMMPGKGIVAADESERTMNKRLASINVPETEENGRRFRQLLFTSPGLEQYVSGVILYDATIRQTTDAGVPMAHVLEKQGILPGIKVDMGLEALPNFEGEEVSHGLDGLRERLKEYYEFGARFTKWRSVIRITDDLPSETALEANAHVLAHYAALVQEAHMVPMVEPEVLFDGTHTLDRSAEVLEATLATLFDALERYRVVLPGLVLKTSMALPGKESGIALEAPDIARETVHALKAAVPKETAGVVFLSGGQTPVQATENLNAIAQADALPWPVTFSYSRALEEPVLEAWQGEDDNVDAAQQAFLHRLALNVAARKGTYRTEME